MLARLLIMVHPLIRVLNIECMAIPDVKTHRAVRGKREKREKTSTREMESSGLES
jgi:hypothetical protein